MKNERTKNRQVSILLVDDNPDFLNVIREFLEADGKFRVLDALDSASEALNRARVESPDAVVLDLGMPEMTGMEALPLLRTALPDAKILVLTLLDTESYRKAAMRSGADGFLSKSKLKNELVPTLRKMLEADS